MDGFWNLNRSPSEIFMICTELKELQKINKTEVYVKAQRQDNKITIKVVSDCSYCTYYLHKTFKTCSITFTLSQVFYNNRKPVRKLPFEYIKT